MSSRPQFSIDEKLRQVRRRPSTKFVIVEGVDDVPAYSALFCSVLSPGSEHQWEVFQVKGKTNVINFLESYTGNNVRYIVDRDFDPIASQDERLVTLARYSLENYFLCDNIISYSLAVPLKGTASSIRDDLKFQEFLSAINNQVERMLKACFYYQRVIAPTITGNKPSWSDDSIHISNNGTSWLLCDTSISETIDKLIPSEVTSQEIDDFYSQHGIIDENAAYLIPGKMLSEPLRRFTKQFYRSKRSRGGTQFNTLDGFLGVIIANLSVSQSLRATIEPIIRFLKEAA
ncbi:DUF4435 domain-containing protein [Thalassotalea litorea]|uniref:DUF4435 domain-containing protein n=1 Tax=Thalassotalea litorea TaxID=2020715 RepID=A0A5R9IIX3_9GAMM|nr:DUF4435 domain-containing protein [Thalassotalea litorea]TLU61227.1 DUF4435 domain-containing protein [Thalassotalea litorea]